MALKFTSEADDRKASDAERGKSNPFPPRSAEAGHYDTGWVHGAHKGPKGDRKHKAHTRGVVHGLMWRRRNPRS